MERMTEKNEIVRIRKGIKNRGGEHMKLCIPTSGNGGLDDFVREHFGRAPTFTVVDMVNNKVKIAQNTGEHFGGVGNTPDLVAGAGAEIMLCSGLGPRAISAFQAGRLTEAMVAGKPVVEFSGGVVSNAIKDIWAGINQYE
jgi:predicted Fe-Mo cluster-binding NifX family protein